MSLGPVRPILDVYIGFGSTWLTEPDAIVWTDVTADVMDRRQPVNIMRGSTAIHSEPDPGTFSLTLRNHDRTYDPLNAAGPYFGDLVPGVPIKLAARTVQWLEWDEETLTWYDEPLMWTGDPVDVWRGTIKSWPQRYDRGNRYATVPLSGFDGFDKLSRAKIPRSVLEKELLDSGAHALWKLDETSGSQMSDSSGNGFHGAYTHGTLQLSEERELPGGAAYSGIDFDGEHEGQVSDISAALAGRPFNIFGLLQVPYDGATNSGVVLRCGSGNPGNSPTTRNMEVQVTAHSGGLDIVGYARDGDANDGVAAQNLTVGMDEPIVFTLRRAASGAAQMWVNGADETTVTVTTAAAFTSAPGVAIGSESNVAGGQDALTGWLAYVAFFDADLGTSRIAELAAIADAPLDGQTSDERIEWILDELGWPAGLRDLEAGRSTFGPATFHPGDGALEYLRLCATTEDGLLFLTADGKVRLLDRYWRYTATEATVSQMTFSDSGVGVGVTEFELEPADDELLVNVARFTRRGGIEQVAADETSSDLYGETDLQRTDLLHRTDVETLGQAQWTVVTRSQPVPYVRKILLQLHKMTVEQQAQVLGLDLGHRVTCTRTPQGTGSAFDLDFVVGGIQHSVSGAEWLTELYVSPAPDSTVELFTLGTSELGGTHILAY